MGNLRIFTVIVVFVLLTTMGCSSQKVYGDKYALINGVIVDVIEGKHISGKVIIIENDKILKITDDKSDYKSLPVIDLEGQYVVPGLINAHIHLEKDGTDQLTTWLQHGITTVRDLNDIDEVYWTEYKQASNKDSSTTTLLTTSPIITKPDGYGDYFIDSPEEGREAVEYFSSQGVDTIKISIEKYVNSRSYAMLTYDEVKAICDTAHNNNLKVTAHISRLSGVQIAIDAGVDEVAHMIVQPIPLDLIEQMIEKNMAFTPTLELWYGVSNAFPVSYYDIAVENTRLIYEAGGTIVLGTDFGGFYTPFDTGFPLTEFNAYKEAKLSNIDILRSATINGAISCDVEESLGSITEGKIADILVCPKDPLEDVMNLDTLSYVIHLGDIIVYPEDKQ